MLLLFIAALLGTLLLTVPLTRYLIPRLASRKLGQTILEIGPRWHKNKEGTPTMGGLSFLFAVCIVGAALCFVLVRFYGLQSSLSLILTLLFALGNSIVGVVDDLTKFRHHRNEGLSPMQKLVLQLTFAAAYLALMRLYGFIDTAITLPYANVRLELGFAYYFFAMLLILWAVNCVNLTDGIDGLAASVTFLVAVLFTVVAGIVSNPGLLVLGGCIIGATLGFLVYNFHPARIFMGDTGSLFLGGLVTGAAFMINYPLLILYFGIVYTLEGVSDVLQVAVYKLTKKRLFRMAPLHHHFEQCGLGEVQIVFLFCGITLLAGLLTIPAFIL